MNKPARTPCFALLEKKAVSEYVSAKREINKKYIIEN
jgi:hypothetical protein